MSQWLDLSQDWMLGWMPEPRMNRWVERYGDWAVRDGRLTGSTCDWGQILAGVEPAVDYRWQCTVHIEDSQASLALILNFNQERATSYQLRFKPGEPVKGDYILSDGFDAEVMQPAGPAIEQGRDYDIDVTLKDRMFTILLDGAPLGEFPDDRYTGRMPGFLVRGGTISVRNVRMTALADDEVLFEDDFREDSLPRVVPVELADLNPPEWIPARVPGTVQTALLEAGRIEDPYYGYNGPKQKWIDRQRWIYRRTFTIPADWGNKSIRLVFEGIDYHGFIWLNGELLAYHEGMHNQAEFDISRHALREGENVLVVCLLPCPTPPQANVKPFILHRWHFNTDILTIGIWRPVKLYCYENIIVKHPQVITRSIQDDRAILDVYFELEGYVMWPFEAKVHVAIQPPNPAAEPVLLEIVTGYFNGACLFERRIEIADPQLWWPNGHGEQPLYRLNIQVEVRQFHLGNQITGTDGKELRFGIRTLETRWTPDKKGKYPWILVINGRPFFGKGMNWMPIDQMLRLDPARYRGQLEMARDANINILRPWGAGLLETDEFYELCDELGICVWQEFLLANSYYHRFDRNVWRETIRQNVLRLRHHPSLVVWCGGNEFDPDCPKNVEIVDELEHLCRLHDPTRDFHRASPYGGDSHSYQVNWMGGQDYTRFTRDLSVAITEFSMASPTSMESLRKIIPPEELNLWPPCGPDPLEPFELKGWDPSFRLRESAFSMHDAHLSRAIMVMMPFLSEMGIPSNWDEFIEYNQAAHGMLMAFGIDFWRSRWPYCTCAMGWVFNVIWPSSMTWELLDWHGVPKSAFFHVKRAYEPLHACLVYDEMFWQPGSLFLARPFIVNELRRPVENAAISLRLLDSTLQTVAERVERRTVPADGVTPCREFSYRFPEKVEAAVYHLIIDLRDAEGALLSRSVYHPRIGPSCERMPYLKQGPWVADIKRHGTQVEWSMLQDWRRLDDGRFACAVELRNTGTYPAYSTRILDAEDNAYVQYSDNFFWLDPGEAREIRISAPQARTALKAWAWNATM